MVERKPTKAVVIGASVTGSLAARVLTDHFDNVVLVDKDTLPQTPETRLNVPQEHHVHLLLQRGRENMESLYPGLLNELEDDGAEVIDLSHGIKWHLAGRWKNRWPTGVTAHYCSRTLVEHHLRRRASQLNGVEVRDQTIVQDVLFDEYGENANGVRLTSKDGKEEVLEADFILDTAGRGSASATWLKAAGYPEPESEHVISRLGYASRIYRRDPSYADKWNVLLVTPRLPSDRRMAVISPIERDRWMVTTGGWLGEFPEANEESFLEFLKALPVSDIYDVVKKAEPLTDVRRFKLSGGLRRRYDKLKSTPGNYLALGDSVCSFNPIYSQGMSVSSMQVMAFAKAFPGYLKGHTGAQELYKDVVQATEHSWQQAKTGDERFPEVRKTVQETGRLTTAYFDQLVQASIDDRSITLALLKVNNLVADASTLTSPRIIARTLGNTVLRNLRMSVQ